MASSISPVSLWQELLLRNHLLTYAFNSLLTRAISAFSAVRVFSSIAVIFFEDTKPLSNNNFTPAPAQQLPSSHSESVSGIHRPSDRFQDFPLPGDDGGFRRRSITLILQTIFPLILPGSQHNAGQCWENEQV